MTIGRYFWAVAFLVSAVPATLAADPVRLRTTVAGSVNDTDGDGVGDSGSYYGFVLRRTEPQSVGENRAFAEYDVTPLDGRSATSARLIGTVDANGFRNPDRAVNLSMYVGNGAFDLSDFNRETTPLLSFVLPAEARVMSFDFDVTQAFRRFLTGNARWVGFRFDAAHDMRSLIVGGHAGDFDVTLSVDQTAPVPEPATMLLFGAGAGTVALLRRRRRTV